MIDRPEYLKQLLFYKDMDLVKIITGVRRAGKSTLFELYIAKLLKMDVFENQIQVIKLEELENEPLRDYHKLHEHIVSKLIEGKKNYLFLDEIQIVEGFGKVVDSLFIKGVDIYLTGSNSKMLSTDLANQIERQKVMIHMFPLSFKEYLSAYPFTATLDYIFDAYLKYSSFPQMIHFIKDLSEKQNASPKNENMTDFLNETDLQLIVKNYLADIYDKIVLRDIVENKKLPDVGRLKSVLHFMADNIGSPTSINNIAKTMTADGRKIDNRALEKYIDAYLDSFILYKVDRYDIKGKELLKTMNKYYMVDMGLRYFVLGDKNIDTGRILENVVYLELLRRGYTVNIGKVANKEVDFVARKGDTIEYYQVSDSIRNELTFNREVGSLDAISDHNPKFILTRDYDTSNYKGIKIQNVLKWLTNDVP